MGARFNLNIDPVTGQPIVNQGPLAPQPVLGPIAPKLTTDEIERIDAANAQAQTAIPQNMQALQAAGIPLANGANQPNPQQSNNPFSFLNQGQPQLDNGIDLYRKNQVATPVQSNPTAQPGTIERPTLKAPEPQQPLGPIFIPVENRTETTTDQTSTSGLTKESKQALQQASQAQIKAVQAQGDIAARKAAQEGLNKEELAAIQGQNISAEREAREAQKQKEIDAQKALDQSAQDMLGFEFDQDRVWKRATTGQSIAAGIGIALGALAQGFGAKSNAALDAIDKQVQRDIEQQRMEYEKIKDKTRAQESAYGRLRQMGLDDTQARQQLQNATLEQMKMKLEAGLAKQFGAEEAKARTDAATADIQAKYAQETKESKNVVSGTTITKQKDMKQVPGLSGQGLRDYDGKLLSGELAQKVGFMDSVLSDLDLMTNEVKQGKGRYKTLMLGKDNVFTRAKERAAENFGRLQSGGAVTEGEMKIFDGAMRGFMDNPEESLQRIKELTNIIQGRRKAITPSPIVNYHGNFAASKRPTE